MAVIEGPTSRLMKQFGQRIRSLRKAQGIAAQDLARHIGCSPSWVSQVETGIGAPTFDFLAHAAEMLGVDVIDLFCFPSASARHGVMERLRLAGDRRASWLEAELAREGWGPKPSRKATP